MQWELLPPLTFGTERVVITGGLEPAYDVGGDSFDYAVNGGIADLLVLDAVGHRLPAAVLASVAISAYRHARRNILDLPDIAGEIDAALKTQIGASQFTTAVLARLDRGTGRLRWINAEHPEPLILRGTALVAPPRCPPSRPLGLQEGKAVVCDTRLEPGDRLLLYTDGITEARSPNGEFFGEERLADFVSTALAAGDRAPETVRRLMRSVLTHRSWAGRQVRCGPPCHCLRLVAGVGGAGGKCAPARSLVGAGRRAAGLGGAAQSCRARRTS